MGACATKPKVLKEGETPEPAMEEVVVATGGDVQVEDKVVAVDEEEMKVVFEKDIGDAGGDKVEETTEIVDDNKRRSLSNLFKENEKGKEPKESDEAPAEQETSETKKPTEPEVHKEEPSAVKEEPVKVETEKVTSEVTPAPAPPPAEAAAEPKTTETLEEKKPEQTETETTETAREKKPEETR
ncbi:hypothetical protein SADUNF_Sadunf19G0015200 [Salix dunnii]|uniref:Uncharacterized protein n=1 Tax=Salix dunnii TaxID=1413687 RepID=A0A835J1C9_9ROSI|nr:hypothetical protein SADUNF_Sadunf19G0015200 [Salix dunnii]